ncbi:MAG: hypothetical protein EOO39_32935 [Cytophagaceae bacterium]|nr:MAG: hypothetical protein EOO39_32935 [Cytophagaceae bacterium]
MNAETPKPLTKPEPWDTKAFRQTRLCIVLFLLIETLARTHSWNDIALMALYAACIVGKDGVRICLWHWGKHVDTAPLLHDAPGRRNQFRALFLDAFSMVFGFLLILGVAAWEARNLSHSVGSYVLYAAELLLLNLAGWYLRIWGGELWGLIKQHKVASKPIGVIQEPAMQKATVVAQDVPQPLRAGRGN